MRHLISLKEQTGEELRDILNLAAELKRRRAAGESTPILQDKTLIMLFQKTSTRTRLSFEAAMTELGGHAIFLDARTSQFGLTSFRDEIQAVMRYGHILMFRALKAADVETAASFGSIPVIDACSEKYHPAQAIGDLLTMAEHAGGVEKIKKIAWLGIENNVSNTLLLACAKLGIEVVVIAPEVDPASVDQELVRMATTARRTRDLGELKDAQFVHTDTWMNMEFFENGEVKPESQEEYTRRKNLFMPYQVNQAMLDTHCPHAKVMHCMPVHAGYEISREVIDSPNCIMLDQAENRMHAQKGLLVWLLGGSTDGLLSERL